MNDHNDNPRATGDWEQYREYLRFLAEIQLRGPMRARMDPSDLVQQTMLQAHAARDQCRAEDSATRAAWLRKIMNRVLLHAIRDNRRDKRDIRRERSLEASINDSSRRIAEFLAARRGGVAAPVRESSPMSHADRNEQIARMTAALQQLPESQREAIIWHYFHGCTLAEVGEHLGRSGPAVAGLVHRGLKALRGVLRDDSP